MVVDDDGGDDIDDDDDDDDYDGLYIYIHLCTYFD